MYRMFGKPVLLNSEWMYDGVGHHLLTKKGCLTKKAYLVSFRGAGLVYLENFKNNLQGP